MPTTPANRTGASVGCFPVRAAFPVSPVGRRPRFSFGNWGARPAQPYCALRPAGLLARLPRTLSRGFRPASYPAKPLVSFHAYRQLHRWAPSSHRVSAPKRRTEKCGLGAQCSRPVRARGESFGRHRLVSLRFLPHDQRDSISDVARAPRRAASRLVSTQVRNRFRESQSLGQSQSSNGPRTRQARRDGGHWQCAAMIRIAKTATAARAKHGSSEAVLSFIWR